MPGLDALKEMLAGAGLGGDHADKIIDELGIEAIEDLAVLAPEDIDCLHLKPVQRRKFIALIAAEKGRQEGQPQEGTAESAGNARPIRTFGSFTEGDSPSPDAIGASGQELNLHFRCSDGQTIDIKAPSSGTVQQLMIQAMDATGIHYKAQRLVFAGRTLSPDKTLQASDIVDGASIFMLAAVDKFPQRLGPFETSRVSFQGGDFTLSPYSEDWTTCGSMWIMEEAAARRQRIQSRDTDFPLVGQFSPTHPVTLTEAEKDAVNIPRQAREFVWSYPVAGLGQLEGAMSSAAAFLTVGGFVYLDGEHKFVGANTLMPKDADHGGLQFSRPKKWDPFWTMELMRNGRFQPITIKPLNDLGAQHFCWLRPGEVIKGIDGRPLPRQPEVTHGGFAYLFHNNVHSDNPYELALDCYFSVISGEEYKPPDAGNEGERRERFSTFQLISDIADLADAQESLAAASEPDQTAALQDEIRRLEHRLDSATKCVVCQENDKDTILLDCSHICVCKACVGRLRTCPICRRRIRTWRKAYT